MLSFYYYYYCYLFFLGLKLKPILKPNSSYHRQGPTVDFCFPAPACETQLLPMRLQLVSSFLACTPAAVTHFHVMKQLQFAPTHYLHHCHDSLELNPAWPHLHGAC